MFERFDFIMTKDDLLVVIDMQHDFIYGCLGNPETQAVVGNITDFMSKFRGRIIFTRDTHYDNYLDTQEGRKLPIVHTKINTSGWEIIPEIWNQAHPDKRPHLVINKPGFGSPELMRIIQNGNFKRVFFCGVDTEYCIITNAVGAKIADTEVEIIILADCCAGATVEGHDRALKTMETLHMTIYKDDAA